MSNLLLKMVTKNLFKIGKKGFSFLIVVGIIIVMLSFVNAFAVGFPKKISLFPGGSIDTSFSLQNVMEPSEDIVVEAVVEKGAEYISFTEGNRFDIATGEVIAAKVKISVPEDANVGDVYNVEVLFRTVSSEGRGGGGTLQFSTSYKKSFEIEVVEKPEEKPAAAEGVGAGWIILAFVLVVIIVVVVWFIIKSRQA